MTLNILTQVRSKWLANNICSRLKPYFSSHSIPQPKFTFTLAENSPKLSPWDILIENRSDSINVTWQSEAFTLKNRTIFRLIATRSIPYLFYATLSKDKFEQIICDTSDGHEASLASFGYSSCQSNRILLPDLYFFSTNGFREQRELYRANSKPWVNRKDGVVWRGAVSSRGLVICDPKLISNGLVSQRLRMALACKSTDIDFKFVENSKSTNLLKYSNLIGNRIEATEWLNRKYAIDIDGCSNTWDNLYHRLLFGCCVLKVDSQVGFRQWYYDKLKPYEHYVPVKANLGDLEDKYEWMLSNPKQAEKIARAGNRLAQSMTFESEVAYAVRELSSFRANQ